MWFICAQRNYYRCFPVVLFFPRCFLSLCFRQFAICSLFFGGFSFDIIQCISMSVDVTLLSLPPFLPTFGPIPCIHIVAMFFFCRSIVAVFFPIALAVWQFSFVNAICRFFFQLIAKIYSKSKILFNEKLYAEYLKIGINYVVSCVVLKITTNIACSQQCGSNCIRFSCGAILFAYLIWSDPFVCLFCLFVASFFGLCVQFFFVVLFCASLFITNYVWLIVTKSTIRSHDLAQYRFIHTL